MTPEEIERMMDFILRSQADSVIRMDRLEERMEAADKRFQNRADHLQEQLDLLASAARDLLQVERSHAKRIARLEGKGR